MASQRLIAAAACALRINGNIIGYATSITINRSQGVRMIHGIDNPLPQEIAISGPYMVQGSITGFRTRIEGGFEHLRIVNASSISDYFTQQYCTIEILDRLTGELIAKVEKAVFHADAISINARGVVTMNASFMGVFWATPLSPGEGSGS